MIFFSSQISLYAHFIDLNLNDLNYASRSQNEESQSLPIPTRIEEIIYPTIGFPSLVEKGKLFSIILQLTQDQKNSIKNGSLKVQARLGSVFYELPNRVIPKGFESVYKNYSDFYFHRPSSAASYFFMPKDYFQNKFYDFTVDLKVTNTEFFKDKFIITAEIPEKLESYKQRALDLEIKLFQGDKLIVHDIQPHSVGIVESKKDFTFVHLADPQINDTEYYNTGKPPEKSPDLVTQEFAMIQAAKELNFIKPDFALISGDLVGGSNPFYKTVFQLASHLVFPPHDHKLKSASYWNEYLSIISFMRTLNFPVFSAPGNHDGFTAYDDMESVDTQNRVKFNNVFTGKDTQGVMYDGKHFWRKTLGPLYYSFDHGDWHFVALDTYDLRRYFRRGYGPVVANHGGYISKEQMQWLEADLKAATLSGKRIVLFGHHDPRGGAEGMWYGKTELRPVQRNLLQLQDELDFSYQQYRGMPYLIAQEWMSPSTSHNGTPDGSYDSAQELLRLIETYNVTHYLIGHVHADFSDIVAFKNKSVQFIHTTTMCATAYRARSVKGYQLKNGEGNAYGEHWGYRVFHASTDGSLTELTLKTSEARHQQDQHSLDIGHLRVQTGFDPLYRYVLSGILSSARALPTWLPFSDFIARLNSNHVLKNKFLHADPILTVFALLNPSAAGWGYELFHKSKWTPVEEENMSSSMEDVYYDVKESLGKEVSGIQKAMLYNANTTNLAGVLEIPISNKIKSASSTVWSPDNKNSIKRLSTKVIQTEVELKNIETIRSGTRTWMRIPLQLPGVGQEQKSKALQSYTEIDIK